MKQTIIAVAAALAATGVFASESAEFRLDTMDGTRTARAVETIAYSTAWNNGGAVTVAVDGVSIKEANAPAFGDVVWNAAQATPGTHTLTHTCGGETLTAAFEVPVPPSLTLTAESANWSSGSITLRCTDAAANGNAHRYTLFYYDTNKVWTIADSARNVVADASGKVLLTDTKFSSRLGGVLPVSYLVMDETGRASAECATRNRHGIFVGVGEYGPDYHNLAELKSAPEEASLFEKLSAEHGGCTDSHLLTNQDATYSAVDNAFKAVAEKTKNNPGDICVVYFSTHGGVWGKTTVGSLVLYDKPPKSVDLDPEGQGYHEGLLASHIRSLDPDKKGVAVICIVSACHSGAFIDDNNNLQQCKEVNDWCHREDLGGNVAWITAANAGSSSNSLFDMFLLSYGWNKGWAFKGIAGGTASFFDLGEYAIGKYNPIAMTMGLSGGEHRGEQVLRNVMAGTAAAVADSSLSAPSKPVNLSATKNLADHVRVAWEQGSGGKPDWYCVIRRRKGTEEFENAIVTSLLSTNIVEIASQAHPMQYAVAAFNGAGVAINDDFEDGWRTIEVYRATFYYNFPVDLRFSPNSRVSPYIEAGGSLSEELRTETEMLGALDTEGRYEFKGWKTRPTDILNVVSRNFDGSWLIPSITINCDLEYYGDWVAKQTYGMTQNWLEGYQTISTASNDDIAKAAAMTAANGCRTVGECYALGINPEDPNDDLKITDFKMKDGKPVITLNHTTDGSGNSFESRVKTVGKADLSDATEEWREVPEGGDPAMRFFKVEVETP